MVVCAAAPLWLGGCGGAGPPGGSQIPHAVAGQLASQSESVAATLRKGDGCTARSQARSLRQTARYAIATGQIPLRLRPGLLAAVNRLLAKIHCAPPAATAPASTSTPATTSATAPACAQIDARKQALQTQHQAIDAEERAIDQQYKGPEAQQRKQPLEAQKHALDQQQHALDVQRQGCR
jgi:hypothetical protein